MIKPFLMFTEDYITKSKKSGYRALHITLSTNARTSVGSPLFSDCQISNVARWDLLKVKLNLALLCTSYSSWRGRRSPHRCQRHLAERSPNSGPSTPWHVSSRLCIAEFWSAGVLHSTPTGARLLRVYEAEGAQGTRFASPLQGSQTPSRHSRRL